MSRSPYANQAEVSPQDRPALDGPTGREDDQGGEPGEMNAEDARKPIGARPKSAHLAPRDFDDQETADGLNAVEESVRQQAEDRPGGEDKSDLPVFDGGSTRL